MKNKLSLTILTPEKAVLTDKPVDCVTIPAVGGEMGVLPGHAPFVVQLSEGVLKFRDEHKHEVFGIFSGYAEIHKDKVLGLPEAAELAKEATKSAPARPISRPRTYSLCAARTWTWTPPRPHYAAPSSM